ncbi:uncharacterized protein LOC126580564 [Anopheles aquasalis]|uniref:uncharacterized protein LOC126580564 n=1 Tax=Anopheles aquasalis TaxID=42839 RepID=UPI00215B30F1|nr:uncharacterized protein LOC126580564 [Anopheles aquasalis]
MVDRLAHNVLLDVEQAIALFGELAAVTPDQSGLQPPRSLLSAVVHKLCEEELGHVVEIVRFLRCYYQSETEQPDLRVEVLLIGVEELLRYLNALVPCVARTGCTLLVYGALDELLSTGCLTVASGGSGGGGGGGGTGIEPTFLDLEDTVQRAGNLKLSIEYIVRDVASAIAHPLTDDDAASLGALFEHIGYDLLRRLVDEAYADHATGLGHICDFVEHLPCIDQQIVACQVLYRRMSMDSARFRTGATVLAFRMRKVMRYTDFGRSKYAGEMRKLKLRLPEGVYAIVWGYVNIAGTQYLAPKGRQERIGELRCKPAAWIETCSKAAKHELQTDDRGKCFAIKNTHTGLYLTEQEQVGGFCYVESSQDRWTVEVIKRGEDVGYKITNLRTGNPLVPEGDVRIGIDDQVDGFNLVDFNERALVIVQKFELHRKKAACVVQ